MRCVTDLEQLSGPRDEKIVQRFARRVEPTFGFVAYGVLYLFLSSFGGVAGGLLGGLLCWGLHLGKGTAQDVIVLVLSLAA